MSMVTNGLILANIAGVPLGVLVGEGFGWRATFLGVAELAALSLLGILARLPRRLAWIRNRCGARGLRLMEHRTT
jgi:predicted MFS family arabinose efflux permease